MSRGLTIADFVQQVLYAMYKVRLDVAYSTDANGSYHADTDKFKEVVMEANFVLQELQQQMDWNWLRRRWNVGTVEILADGRIQEFYLPECAYKLCTGYNDAVRIHHPDNPNLFMEIPFTSPRNGTVNQVTMYDSAAQLNAPDLRLQAFVVGDVLTFNRPFDRNMAGWLIETDYVHRFQPLHICDATCVQPDPLVYRELVFTEIPDPYYMVVRTAAKRAEGDPSISDRVMSLTDEAMKLLSAMRENDSSKTVPDTYTTMELGHVRVL